MSGATVTGLNNVGGIDKVFSNGATQNKPSLVWVDQEGNKVTETQGEALGVNFKTTVSERDRTEIIRPIGTHFFG
jgi:hypothetical protein